MGLFLAPQPPPAAPKKSRTEKMLEKLGIGPDFLDPKLPKGTFSYSQYAAYHICARAYEFKYVLGVNTPNYPSTSRGSAVHKAIEATLTKKMQGQLLSLADGKDAAADAFDQEAANVTDWGDTDAGKMKQEAVDLFDAFYTRALPKINPVAIEKGFAVKFGDVPMVGWIDLIDSVPIIPTAGMEPEDAALAPRKRVVVDFKTSKSKWSEKDLRLDAQLTLYAAVENTPDVRVDQLIPYKKGADYVRGDSERTPQDVAILKEDVGEVADRIRQGIFPMTQIDSWACNNQHCSFWSLCRGRKY